MARPRHQPAKSAKADDLKTLSSEVLRLRLQQLNLPITGSRIDLIDRLRLALHPPKDGEKSRAKGRKTSGHVVKKTAKRSTAAKPKKQTPKRPARETDGSKTLADDAQESDGEQESDAASSVADLLGDESENENDDDQVFTPAQLAAIQDTVSSTMQETLLALRERDALSERLGKTSSARSSSVATPVGLNRPLDKSLEDKILRGEYIDFPLLLPDSQYRPQSPALQLRYDDSSPDSRGAPLTLVNRKKPVIDSFHKWLDAFTAYMLVIVAVHPRRSIELIKYQQIISRAISKFKGLAWLSYDEQFRRRAAYDLNIAWDSIDLELWTVTFSGLAKPHCSVCSSPFHQPEDCPNQDFSRRPRRTGLVCFDFNKPSGCQRRSCFFPHNCRRCGSNSHALFNCPKQSASSTKPTSGDRSKK